MASPKYNYYTFGNNSGRPRHYKTPEDMEAKIIEYFEHCVEIKEDITVSGLILYLGFSHREALKDYEAREGYSDIIKKARNAICYAYEKKLHSFQFGGAIFALTNIDRDNWKNSQHKDITTGGDKINSQEDKIDLATLTDEELEFLERIKSKSSKGGKV